MKTLFVKIIIIVLSVSLLSFSDLSIAAEKASTSLADVWVVVPQRGKEAEFEKALKQHIQYRAKQGDVRKWKTYVPSIGDNLNRYIIRYCCVTWSDVDEYVAWSKKKKTGDHWNNNVDQYVASYSRYFSRIDQENGSWPEQDPGFKYFAVSSMQPRMGQGMAIGKSKKLISDYAKAMKWPFAWSWSSSIGGKSSISLVVPYKNYAGMTPPEKSFSQALAAHLGDPKKSAQILKDWSSNFKSSTYTVYALREDLSMMKK